MECFRFMIYWQRDDTSADSKHINDIIHVTKNDNKRDDTLVDNKQCKSLLCRRLKSNEHFSFHHNTMIK